MSNRIMHRDFGPVHLVVDDGRSEITMEDISFKMTDGDICDMANCILDYYDLKNRAM